MAVTQGPAADPTAFILAQTALAAPPLVAEIKLHLATEITPIWEATEATLTQMNLPPPYWAFAWAGGQALTRFLIDHPDWVIGKRVLDFAAGSGLSAIGAAKAGAASVQAAEIDDFAIAAIALNARANNVAIELVREECLIGRRAALGCRAGGRRLLRAANGGKGHRLVPRACRTRRRHPDGRSRPRLPAAIGACSSLRAIRCRRVWSWKTALSARLLSGA